MKNFRLASIVILSLLQACSQKQKGPEVAQGYLRDRNLVADHTIDSLLIEIIPEIQCIASGMTQKQLVLADSFDNADTNMILILPFRRSGATGQSSGFTDLSSNTIFICPPQIREFIRDNSLSGSDDIKGYLGIILLHELGHFVLGQPGKFDESALNDSTTERRTGQIDMGTEPQLLTRDKKIELRVDSVAIEMLRDAIGRNEPPCFNICIPIQLAIAGAEFMLFGKRLIKDFGAPYHIIKDQAWSHPNIELRLAFMNYYLNPSPEKKAMIDQYLYDREIAPIERQSTDPRIYQGNEKVLQ
jgi:hypothetical protein